MSPLDVDQTFQGSAFAGSIPSAVMALAHGRAVDLALIGQRLERRHHDEVAVHFKVPAQRGAESERP